MPKTVSDPESAKNLIVKKGKMPQCCPGPRPLLFTYGFTEKEINAVALISASF